MNHKLNCSLLVILIGSLFFHTLALGYQNSSQSGPATLTESGQTGTAVEQQQKPQLERRPRVGQIDPNEKDKYKTRFESKDNRIFGFGATKAFNVGTDEVLYSVLTGYEWQVGATGGIPAEAQFIFGDSSFYFDGTLGFKHYFSDEDFSPFLKGLIGIGGMSLKDESTLNGFAYRGVAGVTFFRTSTKHLELSASFGSLLKKAGASYPNFMTFGIAVLY